MTGQLDPAKYLAYIDTLPIVDALWWFIENVPADAPYRTEMFFHLRERVRDLGVEESR
jgi:hypothetical protein